MPNIKLPNSSYEYIKQTIIDNLEYYKLNSYPLDPFEFAMKLNINVIPYSKLDKKAKHLSLKRSIDGYLFENPDGTHTIYYNDKCRSKERIKNTIMHEIGHYLLGHTTEGPFEEAEANFFAKYALAPPPLIYTMVKDVSPKNIADVFKISDKASVYAFHYFKKWLIKHNNSYTDYEAKLLLLCNQ